MSNGKGDAMDPKGLIRESYRIEGISEAECRSILMDWALSLAPGQDQRQALEALLALYGVEGHPMTKLMQEGLSSVARAGRRGGWRGRRGAAGR
ncbi:hypothetical protein SAMN06297129_2639 [Pseudooceanicola antarcticus]|uniref:Uncharacterized protein n=1 Tax=Pseudooceanicola antarcticus TaxID=1247613 RepID=A0A285J387_9RHOB|nr:hypothetical protein [Pseudooceanicola antarcticus]PJE29938.1 hypothetical protein CVM39_08590 [Pseudooceanicola antarcticus]SNY53826.1 hypothetical protein SAMN06297129_2639 [Pseudooceanicola antarcticus]